MKIRRKLFASMMSILLLLCTFTTSTFAWFQINSEAHVSGFNFQVSGGEGFQLSLDGINYSGNISASQMKLAIAKGSNPNYIIENNVLYDNSGLNPIALDNTKVNDILSKLLLIPLTSSDGITLMDQYNSHTVASSGNYVQFSIYIKTVSETYADNFKYGIYLLNEDTTLRDGRVVPKCSFESDKLEVTLKNRMTINTGDVLGPDQARKTVDVYTANAMRMSIQDTSLETPKATIYELGDTLHPEANLGSYATNYNKETDVNDYYGANDESKTSEEKEAANLQNIAKKDQLNSLYNAELNAMYTYYNVLRPYSQLTPMSYVDMPKTYRALDITNSDQLITTVESGEEAKLVTFRFWIEGWDADCFDGLSESIKVKLSFTSTRL